MTFVSQALEICALCTVKLIFMFGERLCVGVSCNFYLFEVATIVENITTMPLAHLIVSMAYYVPWWQHSPRLVFCMRQFCSSREHLCCMVNNVRPNAAKSEDLTTTYSHIITVQLGTLTVYLLLNFYPCIY